MKVFSVGSSRGSFWESSIQDLDSETWNEIKTFHSYYCDEELDDSLLEKRMIVLEGEEDVTILYKEGEEVLAEVARGVARLAYGGEGSFSI